MAITFSCVTAQNNIGESKCTKGKLANPSQIMKVDENFTFTLAQSNDIAFWTAAIKTKQVTLFPKMFSFESAPVEPAYEETTFGAGKTSQGKYGFRLMYNENLEMHKNIFTWDGNLDNVILFDDGGKLMATLVGGEQPDPADNTYGGLSPQLFSVENQTIEDAVATKTPLRMLFEDADEWNVNGHIFDQTFLSQVKSLTSVTLTEASPAAIATLINVTIVNNNDGSPRSGLTETDFTYTGGTLTGASEPVTRGLYALVGVGLTTGDLNLVEPPSSSQFVESSGLINITI